MRDGASVRAGEDPALVVGTPSVRAEMNVIAPGDVHAKHNLNGSVGVLSGTSTMNGFRSQRSDRTLPGRAVLKPSCTIPGSHALRSLSTRSWTRLPAGASTYSTRRSGIGTGLNVAEAKKAPGGKTKRAAPPRRRGRSAA